MDIIRFSTKPDMNGNTYGVAVDVERKEMCTNFYTHKDDIKLSKKDLRKLENYLAANGYTTVISIKRG